METHYSILSAQIRPEIGESITIGFVLAGEGNVVHFNYSKNKLAAAKALLKENAFRLLKDAIKNIEITALTENASPAQEAMQLTLSASLKKNSFSWQYLSYLSRYNNNILTFSSPRKIDVPATQEMFLSLFNKFIDDTEPAHLPAKRNGIEAFKQQNKENLGRYYNIDKEITSKEITSLITPVKVDFVGQNEIPVYIQSVDLEKNIYHIQNDLAQLAFLDLAFIDQDKKAKGFVIAAEPSKKEIRQHEVWKQLKSNKQFEYIDITETSRILEYAEKHGVHPLIAEEGIPKI